MFSALFAISFGLGGDKKHPCCSMSSFVSDPDFIRAHASPAKFNFLAQSGKMVTFNDAHGKPTSAYWIAPAKGNTSAVIMIHEWWGLNDYIKANADRLHREGGYGVLAIDLYEGRTTTDPKVAGDLMAKVDETRSVAIVSAAVKTLKGGIAHVKRIGTIGYCFGGGWSERTAIEGGANVQACVMYYGMPTTDGDSLHRLKAPVLMVHATQDKWITEDVVSKFQSAMKGSGKPIRVLHFDADHAFANPSNPHFDKHKTDLAWKSTMAFFKKHLGS